MRAVFLSPEQLTEVRVRNYLSADVVVMHSQPHWPRGRASALLRRCVAAWGCGPAVAANRLSIAHDEIEVAFDAGADCVLLMRGSDRKRTPVIIRDAELAEHLAAPDDVWVDLRGLNHVEGMNDAF